MVAFALQSQNFGFFRILVFFKLYFGHVPDCILAWNFFTIFFDPCRINRKIFEPIGRYWRRQTTGKTNNPLNSVFLRHPAITRLSGKKRHATLTTGTDARVTDLDQLCWRPSSESCSGNFVSKSSFGKRHFVW